MSQSDVVLVHDTKTDRIFKPIRANHLTWVEKQKEYDEIQ